MTDHHGADETASSNWHVVGFVACTLGPSGFLFQKYAGSVGAWFYLATAVILVCLLRTRTLRGSVVRQLSHRQHVTFAWLTFFSLLALFWCIYPHANSTTLGQGSDRDDALNIATARLLSGQYPYAAVTYLQNAITPLPGSLVLAVPFVVLGNSAYQNLFWLIVFFLALETLLEDKHRALPVFWITLLCSPAILHQLVTGGDLLANGIYVFCFTNWLTRAALRPAGGALQKLLLAVLFGIGLASRAHFIFITPLVFSYLVRTCGVRVAVRLLAAGCGAFALITVPFYVHSPETFSPLHTLDKLRQFESLVPHVTFIVPALSVSLALVLALARNNEAPGTLFRNCALVLALPVSFTVLFRSIQSSELDLSATEFGLSSLFFGVAAVAPSLFGTSERAIRQ